MAKKNKKQNKTLEEKKAELPILYPRASYLLMNTLLVLMVYLLFLFYFFI